MLLVIILLTMTVDNKKIRERSQGHKKGKASQNTSLLLHTSSRLSIGRRASASRTPKRGWWATYAKCAPESVVTVWGYFYDRNRSIDSGIGEGVIICAEVVSACVEVHLACQYLVSTHV
jgi:hypothetical protein